MTGGLWDDELVAEDAVSLFESSWWTVWISEGGDNAPGPFQPCELCGMLTCPASVRHSKDCPDGKFTRAWWEPGLGRMHTPRRCYFLRDLHIRRPIGPARLSTSQAPSWRDQISVLHYGLCLKCSTPRWKSRYGQTARGERWVIACRNCHCQAGLVIRADPGARAVPSRS